MFDPNTLTTTILVILGLTAMTLILRAIRGGDPVDLASVFPHAWDLDWPRGVQEEEPMPWRFDRLPDRSAPLRPVGTARPAAPSEAPWDAAA